MEQNVYKKKLDKKVIIAIVVSVVVILGGIVTLFFLDGKKDSSKEKEFMQETVDVEEDPQANIETEEGTEVPVANLKESAYETNDITLGIDVSEFQGNIDWKKVADAGVDFVMVRVGYRGMKNGVIKEDACAKYNLQEATKYGIKAGAYFFSTAINEAEAKEEAEWTAKLLAGYAITYPVAYNCEGFQNTSSRQHDMTISERTVCANSFLETIEEQGYVGMFYAAKSELEGNALWDADSLALGYRTWVAQYSKVTWPDVQKPDYSKECAMWQYTNRGTINGIKGSVDLNVAYFGYSQITSAREEGSADEVGINLEAGVKFEEVEQQITAKDSVNLRSSMNQADNSNVVASLKNGEIATRTGIGNNGWSRIIYNGQKVYCVSSYITTDTSYTTPKQEESSGFKTQFVSVSEKVTAKELTNLRNRPSVEAPSEVIVALKNGEIAERTGVSNEGWSRVVYNGQTLYCISSYLEVIE